MIGGHSKFLLVTGECCKKKLLFVGILCVALVFWLAKRDDKCCPAMHSPEMGSGVLLVLQNSLRFFDRHSLFTSGFYWFCVSLRFSCQSFRTSVFVPRSLASKLQDHCYKQLFFWEGFNAWSGILVARHGLFLPHVLCKQSKVIYNQSFLCGEPWKKTTKRGQV